MTAINKIKGISLKLLISVLLMLVALQTTHAGGIEDDSNNTIIVSTDGIAKVVDLFFRYSNSYLLRQDLLHLSKNVLQDLLNQT